MSSKLKRIDTSNPKTEKIIDTVKINQNFNTDSKTIAFIINSYNHLKNENRILKKQLVK